LVQGYTFLTAAESPAISQAEMLRQDFGGMSAAILAGFVDGTPWGMPSVSTNHSGAIRDGPDLTALGWAMLVARCADAERA
jgi:hypothetical protein